MVAASVTPRCGRAQRAVAVGADRYRWIVMTVRAVVSPNAVVWTIAVDDTWPNVAPLGIVVDQVALPSPAVSIRFDVTAGTPGAAIVNVTRAPSSGRPSGSITTTDSVTR